jgi:hypothetical protein
MYDKWNKICNTPKAAVSTNVQVPSSAFHQCFDEGEKNLRVVGTYTHAQVSLYLL